MPRYPVGTVLDLSDGPLSSGDLFCERCQAFDSRIVKIAQPSTLSQPLTFWVCTDIAACAVRVKVKLSHRPASERPALVTDLYPA